MERDPSVRKRRLLPTMHYQIHIQNINRITLQNPFANYGLSSTINYNINSTMNHNDKILHLKQNGQCKRIPQKLAIV